MGRLVTPQGRPGLQAATGSGASAIAAASSRRWICWLRQKGKALYTAEGRPGFDVDTMTSNGSRSSPLWRQELRQKKAIRRPTSRRSTIARSPEPGMLALLHSAAIINQIRTSWWRIQVLSKTKLKMTMQPSGGPGAKPGPYLKPSMLFSIAGRSHENAAGGGLSASPISTSPMSRPERCSASSAVCRRRRRHARGGGADPRRAQPGDVFVLRLLHHRQGRRPADRRRRRARARSTSC